MRKALSLTLIACVAAALAPASAGAAYKKPKTARFYVSAIGTQVVNYEEPQRNTYKDCQGQRWTRAKGNEVMTFRSKKTKALVTYNGRGGAQVKFGTWDRFAAGKYALAATGGVERVGEKVFGIEPSVCFELGQPTESNTGPYDCGPRKLRYKVSVGWSDTIALDLTAGSWNRYENCPVSAPDGVLEGSFTRIESEPFPAEDVFDPKFRVHEILAAKDFEEKTIHDLSTARVTWKIRFERQKSK